MDYLEKFKNELNPTQFEAVERLEGPLLILAGAGSGKTRVLTYRIANLILQGEATPSEILAVTFTNKAAREMESRTLGILQNLEIPVFEQLWIGTFHSTCVRILRENIQLLDYQPFFGIYDAADQLSLIKKVLVKLDINEKIYPAKSFRSAINEVKQLGMSPQDVEKKSSTFMDDRSLSVYKEYELEMKNANALDFGDLLMKTYDLFRSYPDILEQYQNKFKFILVDEYQDTNHIQYLIVKMLAEQHQNICVVGDEDQSIYSWRGADIRNILDFEKDFKGAIVVKLEENYRSTKNIVSAATHLIKNNSQRKEKTLFTNNTSGEKITVREEQNEYEEARYVVKKIEMLNRDFHESFKDAAVFYRTNAQSRVLEEQLRANGIPYKLVGGIKFYERMEIKDIIAYMKLLLNTTDDVSCKRIINVPARGIGKTTIEKIENASIQNKTSFFDAIQFAIDHRLVHAGATKKLRAFRVLMDEMIERSKLKKTSEVYLDILDATQYIERLKAENTTESMARIDNLEEFNNAITQFESERGDEATLQSFLEEMALVSDVDQMKDQDDSVTLMTLHISKGLEFPNVFIVGMEDGLFPSGRSFDSLDPSAMEEERRLAYVGMTRAEKRLFLLHARTRRVWGQEQQHPPSRFIEEIPKNYVSQESAISRPRFVDRHSSSKNKNFSRGPRYRKKQDYDFADQMPQYEDFSDDNEQASFSKGMRVRHPTFGVGSIYAVEGSGENVKVSVMFGDRTTKKFVAKYARLERV